MKPSACWLAAINFTALLFALWLKQRLSLRGRIHTKGAADGLINTQLLVEFQLDSGEWQTHLRLRVPLPRKPARTHARTHAYTARHVT